MPKYKAPHHPKPNLQLSGAEEMPATYSDVFVVATEKDTNMSNLFFFQSQVPITALQSYGTVQMAGRQHAKCVAHLILTERAMDILFKSLADNRGIKLPSQSEEQE
jgi:hypothetical protein